MATAVLPRVSRTKDDEAGSVPHEKVKDMAVLSCWDVLEDLQTECELKGWQCSIARLHRRSRIREIGPQLLWIGVTKNACRHRLRLDAQRLGGASQEGGVQA